MKGGPVEARQARQNSCITPHLNAEYDGKKISKASNCRSTDGHNNGNRGGLVSSFCLFTHVGACIKACDGELGHQHSDQKDIPATPEEIRQPADAHASKHVMMDQDISVLTLKICLQSKGVWSACCKSTCCWGMCIALCKAYDSKQHLQQWLLHNDSQVL